MEALWGFIGSAPVAFVILFVYSRLDRRLVRIEAKLEIDGHE